MKSSRPRRSTKTTTTARLALASCARRLSCILLLAGFQAGCAGAPEAMLGTRAPAMLPSPASWRTEVLATAAEMPPTTTAAPIVTAALPAHASRLPGTGSLIGPSEGLASYYFQDQTTASGERFDRNQMTAAHPTLPFGTRVRVTAKRSGRSVVVRINDRGPFRPGRIIDLSQAAAERLAMTSAGLAHVRLEVLR